MPTTDTEEKSEEHLNRQEFRRRKFFKVVEILLWVIVTIIGVAALVLATLYAYGF
jgi:cell division septal protein FtsQ